MRYVAWIVVLACSPTISAQHLSDEGLRPYITLWKAEEVDSIRSILPTLSQKYPGKPEILFFQAVFEMDGEKAAAGFLRIVNTHPDSYFADEALFRLIQHDYALGQYRTADTRVQELVRRYPQSPWAEKAGVFAMKAVQTDAFKDTSAVTQTTARYTLQLGAFSRSQNAEDLKTKLVAAGFTGAATGEKTVAGKKYFTVTWGSFADKDAARREGDRMKSKMNLTYSIVEK